MEPGKFNPFTEGHLDDVLRAILAEMKSRVSGEDQEYLLNVNEEEYVGHLLSEFSVDVPLVDFDNKFVTSEERMIKSGQNPGDFFFEDDKSYKRQVVIYHLPFSGDIDGLKYMPNPAILWSSPLEYVTDADGTFLTFDIVNFSNDADYVKREADGVMNSLKTQLGHIKNQIDGFNSSLRGEIEQVIRERKKDLLSKTDFLTALGVPVKKKEGLPETFSIPAPPIPKKIIPRPSVTMASGKPDPTLDMSTYEEILKVIHDLGKAIERMPSTYEGKDEEALRDHFLMYLEPRFAGSATGETFNKKGKTDILLRYENSNVFVAECKFWNGEAKFMETIDQILSYLAWRDSKAAIVLFVKNQDFTSVINSVKEALPKHSNFLSVESEQSEGTILRCKFFLNGDKDRQIFLSVTLFHFPPVTSGDGE